MFTRVFLHSAAWLLFFLLPFLFFAPPRHILPADTPPLLIASLLVHGWLIVAFYFNYVLAIPRFYFNRRYTPYIGCLVLIFIPLLVGLLWFHHSFLAHRFAAHPTQLPPPPFVPAAILRFCFVWATGLVLRIYQRWRQAEQAHLHAELAYLRAQINPHFLFNTLNGIYILAVKGSERTADAIFQLSALMRYATTEAQRDVVPLDKEVEYIQHFIDLQQLRLTPNVTVSFSPPDPAAAAQWSLPPLLLGVFVENAFKYGVSTEHPATITIAMQCSDKEFYFAVTNTIFQSALPSSGIGIANASKRLAMLYPNRHRLAITQVSNIFRVCLEIKFGSEK